MKIMKLLQIIKANLVSGLSILSLMTMAACNSCSSQEVLPNAESLNAREPSSEVAEKHEGEEEKEEHSEEHETKVTHEEGEKEEHAKPSHEKEHSQEHGSKEKLASHEGSKRDWANRVSPWTTINELKQGNKRFRTHSTIAAGNLTERRKELTKGQKPKAIVLSCADSRVPPELVFNKSLGELFVIRVAGEALDSSVVSSIEYAVEHLGTSLILVMGHDSCGAVKAALESKPNESVGSKDLDYLVSKIKPHIMSEYKSRQIASVLDPKTLGHAVEANAEGVAHELLKRSAIIREAVEENFALIAVGVYHLNSGKVDFIKVNVR